MIPTLLILAALAAPQRAPSLADHFYGMVAGYAFPGEAGDDHWEPGRLLRAYNELQRVHVDGDHARTFEQVAVEFAAVAYRLGEMKARSEANRRAERERR